MHMLHGIVSAKRAQACTAVCLASAVWAHHASLLTDATRHMFAALKAMGIPQHALDRRTKMPATRAGPSLMSRCEATLLDLRAHEFARAAAESGHHLRHHTTRADTAKNIGRASAMRTGSMRTRSMRTRRSSKGARDSRGDETRRRRIDVGSDSSSADDSSSSDDNDDDDGGGDGGGGGCDMDSLAHHDVVFSRVPQPQHMGVISATPQTHRYGFHSMLMRGRHFAAERADNPDLMSNVFSQRAHSRGVTMANAFGVGLLATGPVHESILALSGGVQLTNANRVYVTPQAHEWTAHDSDDSHSGDGGDVGASLSLTLSIPKQMGRGGGREDDGEGGEEHGDREGGNRRREAEAGGEEADQQQQQQQQQQQRNQPPHHTKPISTSTTTNDSSITSSSKTDKRVHHSRRHHPPSPAWFKLRPGTTAKLDDTPEPCTKAPKVGSQRLFDPAFRSRDSGSKDSGRRAGLWPSSVSAPLAPAYGEMTATAVRHLQAAVDAVAVAVRGGRAATPVVSDWSQDEDEEEDEHDDDDGGLGGGEDDGFDSAVDSDVPFSSDESS